ncbi:MAG: hydrolase 1, exosortase A system-associated [Rhodoferax sp.]|nr:hydrolase 1, exosortase A system-associated [Rhodoferax sp.]
MTAPPCTESGHVFDVAGESLVGVLSRPATKCDTALLIVVGGPQYRAGSHRQFVDLARSVAAAGHAVLRFDHRGMGDSGGAMRSFEQISDDIAAAIDLLFKQLPGLRRVVLWGLCDGASAALIYCQATNDQRVGGLCVVNPWVRSAQTLARTHVKHYYLQRLREPAFWRKVLSGGVAWTALRGLFGSLRTSRATARVDATQQAPFQLRMADAWHDTSRPILLLLSGRDYTAREFIEAVRTEPAWAGALERSELSQHMLEEADHTFSDRAHQQAIEALTCEWLAALPAPSQRMESP